MPNPKRDRAKEAASTDYSDNAPGAVQALPGRGHPPGAGVLRIELYGELGALLTLGEQGTSKHPRDSATGVPITLVAGARNQLNLLFQALDIPATPSPP